MYSKVIPFFLFLKVFLYGRHKFVWDNMRFWQGGGTLAGWVKEGFQVLHTTSCSPFSGYLNPRWFDRRDSACSSEFPRYHHTPKVMSSVLQIIFCCGFVRCLLWIFSSLFQVSSLHISEILPCLTWIRLPLWVAGWALLIIPIQMNNNEMDS